MTLGGFLTFPDPDSHATVHKQSEWGLPLGSKRGLPITVVEPHLSYPSNHLLAYLRLQSTLRGMIPLLWYSSPEPPWRLWLDAGIGGWRWGDGGMGSK